MTQDHQVPRIRYDKGCLTAHALDVVGERWSLLVVRELILAPNRFQMLRAGLPGITAAVLTQRLTQLIAAGVVVYDGEVSGLTGSGRGLLPVLQPMCR